MRKAMIAAALALLAGLVPLPAMAQDGDGPSAAQIPPEIPTEAFAAQSQLRGARLSPDGKHLAFTTVVDEKLYLTAFDAQTLEMADAIIVGEQDDFNWFRWAGNNRLLISRSGRRI